MVDILGATMPSIPSIDITGFLSSTWVYVVIVGLIGFIFVAITGVILFLLTYNKKVVIFENISGQGYQSTIKTRARTIKLGVGGEELLKTLRGGQYLSAYGRKMGKNTYWYAKGQDGYLYNALLGDLDAKMGMLDIEPVDRDVRMMHVALDRLSKDTYGKTGFLEKYGIHLMLFLFLIVLVLGMWFIVGKIGNAVAPLAESGKMGVEVAKSNVEITARLDSILRAMGKSPITNLTSGSGLVSAG